MQNPNIRNELPRESSELINIIKGVKSVLNVDIHSHTNLCRGNYKTTISFNNGGYVARINYKGYCYKTSIIIEGNRPNPKVEKEINRLFSN